jgi:hypothetical protein
MTTYDRFYKPTKDYAKTTHLPTLQNFIIGITIKLNQFAKFIIKFIIISTKQKNNSK